MDRAVRAAGRRRHPVLAGVLLGVLTASVLALGPGAASAYDGAPWFEPGTTYAGNFPDPSIVLDGGTYHAYGTSTGGAYLPVMTSSDLQAWRARSAYAQPACVGGSVDPFFNDAFPCPAPWGQDRAVGGRLTKEVWAPGPAKIGGGWVVYYSIRVSTQPDRFCLGLATAAGPLGPFVDASTQPFQCDADPAGSIDPQPFVDADGTPWLVWKSEGYPCPRCEPTRIWSRRLSPDGRSFAPGSQPHVLLETTHPDPGTWEGTVIETPAVVRFQGRLLLFYSGNQWPSTAYAAGWAECASLESMCQKSSQNPVLRTGGDQNGPGGATPFVDKTGKLQLAYQYWNPPYSSYPADPGCDGNDPDTGAPLCASQGQRRLRIRPVYVVPGGLQIGGTPPPMAVARATDDSCPPGVIPEDGFADVPPGNVHEANIDCVVHWQLAQGSGAGYAPGGLATRAQMASFIARLVDRSGGSLPPAAGPDRFPDDAGSVHEANINRLAAAGIVGGRPDGTYGPNEAVTRAQMATFLARAYEYRAGRTLSGTTNWFPDDEGSAHEANINKAAGAGFTGGRADGSYAPLADVARDQMASFLARVLDLLVEQDGATLP